MKSPKLLFSLPLLLGVLASQALPPDSSSGETSALPVGVTAPVPVTSASTTSSDTVSRPPASVPGTVPVTGTEPSSELGVTVPPREVERRIVRTRGRNFEMEILKDQYFVRKPGGREQTRKIAAGSSLAQVSAEAKQAEAGGDRADLIAYRSDLPKTDKHKILITKRVTVRLAQGVVPDRFARVAKAQTGATRSQHFDFAKDVLILTYPTAAEALDAVENLRNLPGALGAETVIAVRRNPEFIPTPEAKYFSGGGGAYSPLAESDNIEGATCLPFLCGFVPQDAYQWWANNRGAGHDTLAPHFIFPFEALPTPPNMDLPRVDLGDFPGIGYSTAFPLVPGEACDLRLPLAWELEVDEDEKVTGNNVRVLIIDDGILKNHPDLALALDVNNLRHFNYYDQVNNPNPIDWEETNPTDSHGTSLAGIVGARVKVVGSNINGVAPKSRFQSAVAIKAFVDEVDWAQAFAQGSKLQDTDKDTDLLDEKRTGVLFFDVCLNASSESGSEDARQLYPEDYLWKRAIQYGARDGRNMRGIIYVTSAGNGGEGHNTTNYVEQKNSIHQIPVAGVSDLGRRIAYSNLGSNIVTSAPTWGDELPPVMRWSGGPAGWPAALPTRVNPSVDVEDLPYLWRRVTQGIPTISARKNQTPKDVDINFSGTSASAAQVAGVVALMLEMNDRLTPRDVKEILLRSSRVCNDVRVGADPNVIWPTQWQMSPLGRPFHLAFGTGVVDAHKAVEIAKLWQPLGLRAGAMPLPVDVTDRGFGKDIGVRTTETGGYYYFLKTNQVIPLMSTDRPLELIVPPPPANLRLEHIEVRIRLYHQRRGDLEVTLIAPPEEGWEEGRPLESPLFMPHREDSTENLWDERNEDLRSPMDWTFTTVRHWGTRVSGNGVWKVRVRDAIDRGKNTTSKLEDRAVVNKDNPTDRNSQRVEGVAITYHGTQDRTDANDPPEVTEIPVLRYIQNNSPERITLQVEELGGDDDGPYFPVTSWDIFNTVDLTPRQPSAPARDFCEFFPPALRDPAEPDNLNKLIPLEAEGDDDIWPNQPKAPWWLQFEPFPTGAAGALVQQPVWAQTLSPDRTFFAVRDEDNDNDQTNFIYVRLNRKTGELDVIPKNQGRFSFMVYAENMLGMSKPRKLEFTVLAEPAFDAWQDLWWDEPELGNDAISGRYADPDNDGLVNVLEYKMRLNPLIAEKTAVPALTSEGGENPQIVYTFFDDKVAGDVILKAQVSEDLTNWTDLEATQLSETNSLRTMEARVPVSDGRLFLRLQAR